MRYFVSSDVSDVAVSAAGAVCFADVADVAYVACAVDTASDASTCGIFVAGVTGLFVGAAVVSFAADVADVLADVLSVAVAVLNLVGNCLAMSGTVFLCARFCWLRCSSSSCSFSHRCWFCFCCPRNFYFRYCCCC